MTMTTVQLEIVVLVDSLRYSHLSEEGTKDHIDYSTNIRHHTIRHQSKGIMAWLGPEKRHNTNALYSRVVALYYSSRHG